jgi:cysteine desulfuration protein SufE
MTRTVAAMCEELTQAQQELVDEFSLFDDWMGRYEYLIDLGRHLPEFPSEWKTAENKIHGCQSQVWLRTQMQNGRLHIDGISDAAIVCGLIAVLLRVFSDRKPQDIVATKPDFIANIGFDQHLSPTRSNGLHAMLEAIYQRASKAAGSQ